MAYNLLKLTNSQVSITTHKKHKINQNTNQTTRANNMTIAGCHDEWNVK